MASSELDQSRGESNGVGAVNAGIASGGGALPRGGHTQMSIGQASGSAGGQPKHSDGVSVVDADPTETQEWLDSLRYVLESRGVDRATGVAGGMSRGFASATGRFPGVGLE